MNSCGATLRPCWCTRVVGTGWVPGSGYPGNGVPVHGVPGYWPTDTVYTGTGPTDTVYTGFGLIYSGLHGFWPYIQWFTRF